MKLSARQPRSLHLRAATQRRLARALIGAGWAISLHGRSAAAATLDQSFGDVPIASVALQLAPPQLFALAVQPDGKIIVGGRFDRVAGQSRMEIARLEADGTLDPSFASPFEATSLGVAVQALALDGSGGIFVGGSFMVGGSLNTLVKLKTDGSVDTAYLPEPSLRFSQTVKLLSSGDKLYVATNSPGLDRLNANGSFDPAFTHFSDTRSLANLDFVLQPSGSLVLGLDDSVVGIGNDGKLASAFAVVPVAYPKLASLNGGEVLLFANFAETNATAPDKRFAYLGNHGGVSSSFGVAPLVRSFLGVLPGDKLLIEQQLPSGESLVRLAPDGTPDGFVVPIDDVVRTIAPYPGNRLLIAGMFGHVENQPRTLVARLFDTSVGGSGVDGSAGGADSGGGNSGAGGTDGGAAGESGAAGDGSSVGDSGTAGLSAGGAAGTGAIPASAGSSAASGGIPASSGPPAKGSSGGCSFTPSVDRPSAPAAAWLSIGTLALLSMRRKRERGQRVF